MPVTPLAQLLILSTALMSACSSQTHSQEQRPRICLSLGLSVPSCLVPSICPLTHPTDMLHTCEEGRMLEPFPDSCLFPGFLPPLLCPSLPYRGGDGGGRAHILALCVICLLLGPQQHQAAPCAWSPLRAAGSSLKGGSGGAHAWAAQS